MAVKDSGNYKPSIWNYDYINSLNSTYLDEMYVERSKKLKEKVKAMLVETSSTLLEQLELVDVLKRLGISYHFENEITRITEIIYASLKGKYFANKANDDEVGNLYATSLKFRVLRENGYQVSQDIFRPFLNKNGEFKKSLCKDIKGLLSLYEASYLSIENEDILDLAQNITVRYLEECLVRNECQDLAVLVKHALDLPRNWRMQRLETKWFLKIYEKMESMNPILLELAILDFNMVQAKYQEEIKEMSKWYMGSRLAEKLPFGRDRLFENYLWALAINPEPHLEYCRKIFTKVAVLILIVDDIYDEYGTLDELELFTAAINRWDIAAVDQLPEYMKICYLAVFKCVSEVAYDILIEQGIYVIPCLQKMWAKICSSYLVEAKWLSQNCTPSLNEYLYNGWTTSTGPLMVVHMFFCIKKSIKPEALQGFEQLTGSIRAPSMIIRLLDDLRSSISHGDKVDTPKAVECYISDTGASKEDANFYIRGLINELWKQLNMNLLSNNQFIRDFNEIGKRFARVARCYGDAHAAPESEVIALVAHPLPLH